MFVLSLDTATPVVSVAVTELLPHPLAPGDRLSYVSPDRYRHVRAARDVEAPNRHGEILATLVDDVLRESDVARGELTAVAVGLGPGPFTGLRVGIMTAAALADALRIPAYGVCSLDAIANPLGTLTDDFLVVTDARRRQVYWAAYDQNVRRVAGPEIDTPADVAARFHGRRPQVFGWGVQAHGDAFAGFPVDDIPRHPGAATIAEMVELRVRNGAAADRLDPLYLRRPDARPPAAPKKVTPGVG